VSYERYHSETLPLADQNRSTGKDDEWIGATERSNDRENRIMIQIEPVAKGNPEPVITGPSQADGIARFASREVRRLDC
jgi:hypothetical protein